MAKVYLLVYRKKDWIAGSLKIGKMSLILEKELEGFKKMRDQMSSS